VPVALGALGAEVCYLGTRLHRLSAHLGLRRGSVSASALQSVLQDPHKRYARNRSNHIADLRDGKEFREGISARLTAFAHDCKLLVNDQLYTLNEKPHKELLRNTNM
jgi:hypothetical protein